MALVEPAALTTLNLADWNTLIRYAKSSGLLARVHASLHAEGLMGRIPNEVVPHLIAATVVADHARRILNWEIDRIQRALEGIEGPVVLLKGAAYALLNLSISRGRVSSDVDILVPKDLLIPVETALLDHGWEHIKLDQYAQYFYRHWSHELPPLRHRYRDTIVDIHHTILPPTGRLHPDPVKLMAASAPLGETRFRVLAPVDMVLHSAAHAFQDGDLKAALRDLVDLDGLLRQFGTDPHFWKQLLPRAEELELSRPLYYALRYTKRVLNTPVPQEIVNASQKSQPPWPILTIMDRLVANVLRQRPRRGEGFAGGFSAGLLYCRSHWLRMPPWLLARHLLRKLIVRKRNT
jgi:Uncharacterised nucleotidyltransferase